MSMNINYLWSSLMVEELVRAGVETFCVSPGSRSSPLTLAVARHARARGVVHFDERGSAFYALGVASASRRPCAVITTSGTAAANLLPAVVEASKKKLPLIILTADRPAESRHTGAHQTIDQVNIYGDYARWCFDVPCPTVDIPPEFILTTIDQAVFRSQATPAGPVHLNCMFREPLVPTGPDAVSAEKNPAWVSYLQNIKPWEKSGAVYTRCRAGGPRLKRSDVDAVVSRIEKIKNGIIVAGKLSGAAEQRSVLKLAERLGWPVFPDIVSGLRLGNAHKHVIHYFDQALLSTRKGNRPEGVVHLGGRVTSKRWYDFIGRVRPAEYIMVLNHPLRNDPLHAVTERAQCEVEHFCAAVTPKLLKRRPGRFLSGWRAADRRIHQSVEEYFGREERLSEAAAARLITRHIPAGDGLFLANSLPIRYADMYGDPSGSAVALGANRGASGIDGTLATACGFAAGSRKRVTLLIGDLALLHDLNSLAMLREAARPLVIVALNNDGGGIFSFLPVAGSRDGFEKFFGTPHGFNFEAAALMFGLNYARPATQEEFLKTYRAALKSRTSTIIEVTSNRRENVESIKALQGRICKVTGGR
jgi:2-succinyl-5-enolpyruvyl-6-hydroxy-3-cyclohexene-1-carboxylate synthase